MFREACTFPFCIHTIFLVLSAPHHLLLFHDIFDCTTYVHRSEHHDILASTVTPFFGTASYFFVFITFAHRSEHHDILIAPRCLF